jgi:hypothetical protein
MSIKYLVDTLVQPTGWTCFHTCLVMLHRYRSQRSGVFHQASELEAMLFPDSKKLSARIRPEANQYLLGKGSTTADIVRQLQRKYGGRKPTGLLTAAQARAFADRFGFAFSTINAESSAFEQVLRSKGPFIWVGNMIHTVLVTGLEKKKDLFYVYYNDPNGGVRKTDEFYQFLLRLMPSMKQLGTKKVEVFHLKSK